MSIVIVGSINSSIANTLHQPVKTNIKVKAEPVTQNKLSQPIKVKYLDKTKLSNWNKNVIKLRPILNQDKHLKNKYTLLQNDINKSDLLIQKIYKLQNAPKPQQSKLLKAASELEQYAKRLEKTLSELKKLADMETMDFQSANERQNQAYKLISSIVKTMDDTSKDIIRNMQ